MRKVKKIQPQLEIEATNNIDLENPAVRKYMVKRGGFLGWGLAYLPHYFTVEPADFHFLLAHLLASDKKEDELLEIIGFRGCAKSTFSTLGLPLYVALENIYQFAIICGDTTTQTKMNIENIRHEIESNVHIKEDYGNVFDKSKNWSQNQLQLENGALILGRSRGQKIRGLRHRQYRTQLVIVDDAEDIEWVQLKKNRDKTERWFNGEIIPAQQEDKSKLILIGNLLHRNALMMRVKKSKRADGTPLFKFLQFPLIKNGEITWKGKYPNMEAVQRQKEKVRSQTTWSREYLLKIVSEADQVVKETDLHYYKNSILDERDNFGNKKYKPKDAGVGMDLAISELQSADFTSMVPGLKIFFDDKDHILILPNPVNERMGYDATLKRAEKLNAVVPYGTKWYVEDQMYQRAALQGMTKRGLSVFPMKPISDKKARLETVSPFIIDGTVLFPEFGCEDLIDQLICFGTEEHDDLLDALVYFII